MTKENDPEQYSRHKLAMAKRSRKLANKATNIGKPKPVKDPARRAAAEESLQVFCETYFADIFFKAWSPDHIQVLNRLQDAICHGGLFALAMMRGGGKTQLCRAGIMWATMTGRHEFAVLIAANAVMAKNILRNIKRQLLTNQLLYEDFPEVCHPVRKLQDRANRAKGQHINGRPTYIGWKESEIILPTVKGSRASGAIIQVAGLASSNLRGSSFDRPDGRNVRPSLVLLDDPQTPESAKSELQCEKRHGIIHEDVLGMAGPGRPITAICACTIICKGDLSETMLDRKKSPLWTGQRYQMVKRWPDRMDLWNEYIERRKEEIANDGDGQLATAWYGQQKEVMDAGAMMAWPERFDPNELGALQHAMNLLARNAEAFWAGMQNDPKLAEDESVQLDKDALEKRLNGLLRGVVPLACSHVTAYIDVHAEVLYWAVLATTDGFTGSVIDYGTYPPQKLRFFALASAQQTLSLQFPGMGLEGRLHHGLTACADLILDREWKREDGSVMKIAKCPVDAHWGESTATVTAWCRQTRHAAIVMPSHGQGLGASSKPWGEYEKRAGERLGDHWRIPPVSAKEVIRKLLVDTNHWKTFVAQRLITAVGDRGAFTFFGQNRIDNTKSSEHQHFIQHLCVEKKIPVEGRGRKLDEWKNPPGADNHWWDCLVNAAVAASIQGAALAETAIRPTDRKHTSAADYAKKRDEFRRRTGL